MEAKIAKMPAWKQAVLRRAMAAKVRAYRQNKPHSLILNALLFRDFRAALGGRLRAIINGGAPVRQEVFEFLCATVSPKIIQGYGMKKVACGLAVQELPATNERTVGARSPGVEIKLRKVPWAGDWEARPPVDPVGELLVKGPVVLKGYYKRGELARGTSLTDTFSSARATILSRH
jgi:long-chain acyl-CoA synthetase